MTKKTTKTSSRYKTHGGDPTIESIFWRKGFRPAANVSAETAYLEIKQICAEKGISDIKKCSAEDAYLWAKSHPNSGLNALIGDGWDQTEAAEKWWIEKSRRVIQAIFVVYKEAPKAPTRAFELDPSKWQKDERYKPYRDTRDILEDPEARAILLQRALAALLAVRRKFSTLQELSIVFRAIDEVLETIKPQ